MDKTEVLKQVSIFTDGGCAPNPGRGGYGVVLIHEGKRREIFGGFRLTTSNRMELHAAIVGLSALRMRCRVELLSDSTYLVNTMTKGKIYEWKSKGWCRKANGRIPNADLWKQLLELSNRHDVTFRWIRGHAGHAENERCDRLAAKGIMSADPATDQGYIEELEQRKRDLSSAGSLFDVAPLATAAPVEMPTLEAGAGNSDQSR